MTVQLLRSAIYKGWVWHNRYEPRRHEFRYRVFMMYLDLSEIESVLASSVFWGRRWFHIARFKRSDYFTVDADCSQTIESAVRQEVNSQLGFEVSGSICLLTNLRYFGYITNPISCYYCFNHDGTQLEALLIEVTNTPWGEKHHYVLDLRSVNLKDGIEFDKLMHVSPFMPMDRVYQWRGYLPSKTLRYSLASMLKSDGAAVASESSDRTVSESAPLQGNPVFSDKPLSDNSLQKARRGTRNKQFDSGVIFRRTPVTSRTLNVVLLEFPVMTIKVIAAIYWQALRLWCRKIPFVPHPGASVGRSAGNDHIRS